MADRSDGEDGGELLISSPAEKDPDSERTGNRNRSPIGDVEGRLLKSMDRLFPRFQNTCLGWSWIDPVEPPVVRLHACLRMQAE